MIKKFDLIVTNQNDNIISILLGNGDGTFKTQIIFMVDVNPSFIVSDDVNNDTKLNLVVVDILSGDLAVLLNVCGVQNS